MGGEKSSSWVHLTSQKGSPPRGRGKAGHPAVHVLLERITPAWAGKSGQLYGGLILFEDYPRVGGEKCKSSLVLSILVGSPPRGRGKVCTGELGHRASGITPAWAGKSALCAVLDNLTWDHPRVGGEKYHKGGLPAAQRGSPPRGRGKDFRDEF